MPCASSVLTLTEFTHHYILLRISHMDIACVVNDIIKDLSLVASTEPNERLPKEEQIRCSVYAALRPSYQVVCAERGYGSIDDGIRTECDLFARNPNQPDVWIELKTCWSAEGWVNKPSEQVRSWNVDVAKLRVLPVSSDRYFLLVGCFDCDPLDMSKSSPNSVVRNIGVFQADMLVRGASRPFRWRVDDGITWMGIWAWHWPGGSIIDG